jgi:hypothetical protein
MTIPPSGEQFEIRAGGQRATIVEVGGGLREYEVDSRPMLEPYPLDRRRDGAHERLVMGTRLHPLPGYPFTLDVEIARSPISPATLGPGESVVNTWGARLS